MYISCPIWLFDHSFDSYVNFGVISPGKEMSVKYEHMDNEDLNKRLKGQFKVP